MKKMKRVLAILLAVILVATGTGLSLTKKTPSSAVVEPKGSVSTTVGTEQKPLYPRWCPAHLLA